MALTGPLAANGKQALLGMKIWEEEINAKGGLLGRPVKLVYYDDQSKPSTVPGIYTKLLDVDKVDLVVGGYATNMIAPAMPVVMQKNKIFISLFGLDVNTEFKYPTILLDAADAARHRRRRSPRASSRRPLRRTRSRQTVALAAEDAEFSSNACEGARENAKKYDLRSSTTRPIRRARPTSRRSCARCRRPIADIVVGLLLSAELGRHGEGRQRD